MTDPATPARPPVQKHRYQQVHDRAGKRVRGLWVRHRTYYAQLRVAGQVKQLPLHGVKTIAEATAEMQALKRRVKQGQQGEQGEYPPAAREAPQLPATLPVMVERSLPAAIAGYQADRNALGSESLSTRKREDGGFVAWNQFLARRLPRSPPEPAGLPDLDSKMLKDFAVFRRKANPRLGGRAIDLNIRAIQKVLEWALVEKWLPAQPVLRWIRMARPPKQVRLLTPEELDAFANAGMVSEATLAATPANRRRNVRVHAQAAIAFRDYIYLIWYCGAREQETLQLAWSRVTWGRRLARDEAGFKAGDKLPGGIELLGKHAKAGAGQPAADRVVDFHAKLEAHLQDMYQRRDPVSDLLFPSQHDPAHTPRSSFRKQLKHARALTGAGDVGFHHGRYYFISHAVMGGVDFRTIAYWVSHRDGGILIGKKYSRLGPGHSKKCAEWLDQAF